MKTKILYISSNTGIGGQEVVLKRLLRNLDKTLYQADVLITHFRGPLHDEYEKHSNAVFVYEESPNEGIGATIFQLIKENSYDIIHFCNLWILYELILRIKRVFPRVKIMATLCVDLYHHRDFFANSFRLMENVQPHLWAFTTDSEINKKTFPNITTIRNGIPTEKFKPSSKKPKTVAWVGRMIWAKRAPVIADIARRLPDYSFIMIGDRETTEYREMIKDQPSNLEIKIGLTEDEVADVLSSSQHYLFTSTSESLPLTVLEAMASGCCVISEEVGDIASVLHDGVSGHLIPKDVNLVDWVSENLPLLDIGVSKNARQPITDSFSIEQMVKKYEFFYDVPSTRGGEPRIAFLWACNEDREDYWDTKLDASQNAIMRLSRDNVVQVFVPTIKKDFKKILNGQNIYFYKYSDHKNCICELKKFKPDMIFMNLFHSTLWERLVRAFPNTWKGLSHFGSPLLSTWIARDLDLIMVQQEHLRASVSEKNGFPLESVVTVPFGVRTDIFKPDGSEKKYAGIMVADFRDKIKRQELLVRAWRDIPGRLLLLGRFKHSIPSDYHTKCMALAKELGMDDRIDFMDAVPHDEVPALIRQAKIAFLTSAWEGGSIALMEKMACGLPAIVLSDCSGNTRRVRSGVDALIADPTPESIAKKANELLGKWVEMGQAASERVRREFPYESMYEFYHSLVQRVMEEKRRES